MDEDRNEAIEIEAVKTLFQSKFVISDKYKELMATSSLYDLKRMLKIVLEDVDKTLQEREE